MNLQGIKKRIRKTLAYFFASLIFLFVSLFLVVQIPPIQQYFITKYVNDLNRITGFKSSIGSFRILWFDHLELNNVSIFDPDNNKMIGAERVLVNFKLWNLIGGPDVEIDGVVVDKAEVYLTKVNYSDSVRYLNINVFIDRINEAFVSANTVQGRTPRLRIGEAVINDSKFSYINQDRVPIEQGFNYNQFTLAVDEGQLQHFLVLGDTTEFDVHSLIVQDQKTKFKIHELSTFFRLSQSAMEFYDVSLKAGDSFISDTVAFHYNRQVDLSDFVTKVRMYAHLDKSVVHRKDIILFAPFFEILDDAPITVSGKLNGRVDRFRFTEMALDKGKTRLLGSVEMEGLPDITETFINLNLKQSAVTLQDFSFLFDESSMQRLRPLGELVMNGQFIGYPNDFVAQGDFLSGIGYIRSDINFKVNEKNFDHSQYSGNLELANFNLGTYLSDTSTYQKLNMRGKVTGSGITQRTADFTLNGKISSVGILGYNYTNITTNARLSSEFFSGTVKIDDPNLEFNARGSVDFRKGRNIINLQGTLDTAFVHNLHLTETPIFLHSGIDLKLNGFHLDSLDGTANLEDFRIHYEDESLAIDKIRLASLKGPNGRSVRLESTYIDASFEGPFNPTEVIADVTDLYHEILLNIHNEKQAITEYYNAKTRHPQKYGLQFQVTLKDIKPITDLIDLDLLLSENTTITGKFTSGYTTILQAYANVDTVSYQKNLLTNSEFELTTSKIADSTSVLSNLFISSGTQKFSNLQTKNLTLEGIWNNSHIGFSVDADQANQDNYIRLKGGIDFLRDTTRVKILPSVVHLLDKNWDFNPRNSITIAGEEINIQRLMLTNQDQAVVINGRISNNPEEILTTDVTNFDLSTLNAFTAEKISGTLNARVDLSNYYHDAFVENDLSLKDFSVDNFLIGDITARNLWDTLENKFMINLFVDRVKQRIVNATGYYDPSQKNSPLNIDATLDQADVKIVEPFLSDIFSRWAGHVSGNFHITGTIGHPLISGEGQVSDGQFMVNYLKTLYHFTGTVGLSPNSIFLRDINLTDAFRSKASLSGTITHENFSNMRINMDAIYKNFQVLNTTAKDNSLFYGQAYATGDLNFFGPLSNLKISANARSEKNTKISIPIDGGSSTEKKDFINFVSFTDSTFQENLKSTTFKQRDLTGVSFDFNLDITPDALCEIIFDMKAGDIIRGRGNGDLQLQMDTKGEFSMFGPFEFTQGGYNFTLYDIINKEFEIKKGSRITWYGDPYGGVMSISAAYSQLASLGPIIADQNLSNSPQLRRKYPVEVLLKLDGPILKPNINFDIVSNGIPQSIIVDGQTVRLAFEFQTFKNKLDEQELNRQVFSLIILRKFSAPDALFNTSGSLFNSVSELLSNQLSNWATQVDENLEVDVDLRLLDQEQFNTFQFRLSYSFFNGRLRITRDGTFYSANQNGTTTSPNSTAPSNLSGIAGDWTVEYQLTADGKFRSKLYNRANVNPILNTLGTQNTMTTGASLMYTQSFNEFKDLLRKARNKKKEKETPVDDTGQNKTAVKKDDESD
jgi:hypothetical protein